MKIKASRAIRNGDEYKAKRKWSARILNVLTTTIIETRATAKTADAKANTCLELCSGMDAKVDTIDTKVDALRSRLDTLEGTQGYGL